MSRELEERIAAIAMRQQGVVTRRQLMEAGLSGSAVTRRLRSGRILPLHRGVFLVGAVLPPTGREMAAVLASGPGAVLSHFSAAGRWGLLPAPRLDDRRQSSRSEPDLVDITVVAVRRRRRHGIRLHRAVRLDPDEWTIHDGLPITAPGRTLIDLAGVLGRRELEDAVSRAERDGLLNLADLSSLVVRCRRCLGMPALRVVLAESGGPALSRSEAEARFLALVREARLPPPETNVPIGPYELDFLWRAEGIAVEVDGFRHHSSRPRFEGDRRKDTWLLAGGVKVIRLSWRQIVHDATATAVQIGQALARAGGGWR